MPPPPFSSSPFFRRFLPFSLILDCQDQSALFAKSNLRKNHKGGNRRGVDQDTFSQRVSQGLDGYCGEEPWRPGHKYKAFRNQKPDDMKSGHSHSTQRSGKTKKQVQMLLTQEQNKEPKEDKTTQDTSEGTKLAMSVVDTVFQSTFLEGHIGSQRIKILVDTGSHYSFITGTNCPSTAEWGFPILSARLPGNLTLQIYSTFSLP